jgi:hypothetical protein
MGNGQITCVREKMTKVICLGGKLRLNGLCSARIARVAQPTILMLYALSLSRLAERLARDARMLAL